MTKQPSFARAQEFTLGVGSHQSYRGHLDLTGPLSRTLAYRLIAEYRDGNTWRDYSHSRTLFVNPQLLWRPTEKFSTRLDGYFRDATGNLVSQNVSSTANYQRAYDNPSPALLNLGTLRYAGAPPFTVAEYRTRIGQAFGTWRQDVFDTTGQWVSLGMGEALVAGNGPTGRAYNWFGPNAGFKEPVSLLESDSTLAVTDWLQFRAIGRYMHTNLEHSYYSFGTRQYADGNNPLDFGSGTRIRQTTLDGKFEGVVKGHLWRFDGTLLGGIQYNSAKNRIEDAFFDYSGAVPVAASPNVGNNPAAILTGQQVYHYFDPRVHPFPDTRLVTRWPSEVRGAGQLAYNYTKDIARASYAAASLGAFNHRITLTGGIRRANASTFADQQDPRRVELTGSASSKSTPTTSSYMYGLSVRLRAGLSAYASYNRGETARTGSLVSRVSFGISPPDIVTPAEQAANPVPNDIGEGKEVGLKFDLLEHNLTGSVGWFTLTRGNILVADTVKSGTDPRNAGTEVDSNPATANPGVRQRVAWLTPIDGNITAGYEADLVWTPARSYSLVFGATHLTKNATTVSKPLGADPTTNRDYLVLNGRPLDFASNDMIRIYQRYAFLDGALKGASAGLGVRYQSSFWPQASNSAWGVVFPAFTVVDLTFGYDTKVHGHKVSFTLSVNNVLDKVYIEGNRDYGPPREFFLSTRVPF